MQKNNSSTMHIGIDLGTTNTVIASCKSGRRFYHPVVRDINQYKLAKQMGTSKSLPSVLFFDNDGTIKVGEYAKSKKMNGADRRILYNTKIDMGQKVEYDNGFISGFTPVSAAAEVLKVCRENIRTYIGRDDEFPDVTITVPASFTQNQITDTLKAAEIAGFDINKISILEEPVAALYYYINEQIISGEEEIIDFSETKRVLVYDIGGGTCDVCIVDLKDNDNYNFEVHFVSTNRYTEFGGNDFDEQAAIGLLNKLFKRYDIKEEDIDSPDIKNSLVSSIIPFCEEYKLAYSQQLANGRPEDDIPNASYGSLPRFLAKHENVELDLSYQEYKKYTSIFFQDNYTHPTRDLTNKMRDKNIIKPVYQLLKQLESKGEKPIDCIFLTGGMSKYLPIEDALREYCKCPLIKTEFPMDSVALGAALSSFVNADKTGLQEIKPIDGSGEIETGIQSGSDDRPKLAEAIFIDIENSLPMKIIDSDINIPCKGKVAHIFHVSTNGVRFNLFAGLSEWDPEMRVLYDYSITFKDLVPPDTEAEIEYEIDKNRYLKLYLMLKDVRHQKLELTVDTTN